MQAIRLVILSWLLAGMPVVAGAAGGVAEINQVCAEKSGCFDGDTPGFPVTISSTGSYRLTSNLSTGKTGVSLIEITADRVSLDLNGFSVSWCIGLICGIGDAATAIEASVVEGVRIFNGTVAGASFYGISVGQAGELFNLVVQDCEYGIAALSSSRLTNVTVRDSAKLGVSLSHDTQMTRSTVTGSGDYGVDISVAALIVDSVIAGNQGAIKVNGSVAGRRGGYRNSLIVGNDGSAEVQPISGTIVNLGGNLCGTDTTCP